MLFKGNFQQKTSTILSFNYKDEHTLIIWYYSCESQIDTMIYWRKNPKKAYICAESELDAKCFYRVREKERYWNIYYHYYCIIYWIIYIIDHVILFIRRKRTAKNGELYKNKKTQRLARIISSLMVFCCLLIFKIMSLLMQNIKSFSNLHDSASARYSN